MAPTVLMIDDDLDDILFAKTTFQELQCDIDFEYIIKSETVIRYLTIKGKNPHLILLDLNMPVKDGKVVLKELKENNYYSSIPVIIFTTSASPADKKICYELNAAAFITKPSSMKEWRPVLESICRTYLKDHLP